MIPTSPKKTQRHLLLVFLVELLQCLIIIRLLHTNSNPPRPATKTVTLENRTTSLTATSYPPPKGARSYHRCTVERTPHVSGFLESAQYLLWTNSSLARFGDWEVTLMMQLSQTNSTFFNRTLSELLLTAFTDRVPNLRLGLIDTFAGFTEARQALMDYYFARDYYRRWMLDHVAFDQQYLQTAITAPYAQSYSTNCLLLDQIYQTLRQIWQDKDIVLLRGNNSQHYQYDIYDNARSSKILYAPRYHAEREYESLKKLLLEEPEDKLVILSCGPTCTVLAYDLARVGRRALDLGHLNKDYDWYKRGVVYTLDFWKD